MLFEIKNLKIELFSDKKKYPIVGNFSLNIDEGEFVALVGGSGSGKTITAKSIMHLLPENIKITEGEILLDSKNISSLSEKEFRKISGKEVSMIFQEPMTSLNPLIKVGKQIEEAGLIHGLSKTEAKEKAEKLANLTGLSDTKRILQSYPHELSGGMKQRIMIASALMNNPKLLIADEATTALDVSTQSEIIAILKNLQKAHKVAMLLITHDLSIVQKLCSRVYIIKNGKFIETGTTEQIFSNPKEKYTKALIDSIPSIKNRGQKLPTYENNF